RRGIETANARWRLIVSPSRRTAFAFQRKGQSACKIETAVSERPLERRGIALQKIEGLRFFDTERRLGLTIGADVEVYLDATELRRIKANGEAAFTARGAGCDPDRNRIKSGIRVSLQRERKPYRLIDGRRRRNVGRGNRHGLNDQRCVLGLDC